MQDPTNPIPSADSPTAKMFDSVFRLNQRPDKLSAFLDSTIGGQREAGLFNHYLNIADRHRVAGNAGLQMFKGQDTRNLIDMLDKQGLLGSHMHQAISGLGNIDGGTFLYSAKNRSLFFGNSSSGVFTALPIQGLKNDYVSFGHTTRAVNTLGILGANNRIQNFTFADAFYSALNERLGMGDVGPDNFNRIIERDIMRSKVSQYGSTLQRAKANIEKLIDKDTVFFDLETNGLNGEILNFGAVRYKKGPDGKLVKEEMQKFFTYTSPVDQGALRVHGLSPEVLKTRGAAPFQTFAKEISEFFGDAVVVGHNVQGFDIPKLNAALAKAGISAKIGQNGVVDTMMLTGLVGKTNLGKSLANTHRYFTGKTIVGAHDAMTDVKAVIEVLGHMIGSAPSHAARLLPGSVGDIADMMKKGGVGIEMTQASLKDVLTSGINSRGRTSKYLGRALGLRQKLAISPGSNLHASIAGFENAKRQISTIIKTSGNAGGGVADLALAEQQLFSTANAIQGEFTNLGLEGLWPYGKAEHLRLKNGMVTLPMASAGDVYGRLFQQSEYVKGLGQLYKRSATSAKQAKALMRMGRTPLKSWLTQGAVEAGLEFQHQGFGIRVGVVDFKDSIMSKALFHEGGALLTRAGEQAFASTLPTHSVKLNSATEHMASAIETLFGVQMNNGATQLTNLNRALTFGKNDVKLALSKIADTELTDKQQAIRTMMGGDKTYQNVFKSAVRNRSRLNAIVSREGQIELQFISNRAEVPGSLEMETGGRRFTAVKIARHNKSAKLLEKSFRGQFVVDKIISADEFNKMRMDTYLDHFFATLHKHDMLAEAAHIMTPNAAPTRLPGSTKSARIPIVTDPSTAYDLATKLMSDFANSSDIRKTKLAKEVQEGLEVTSNVAGLDKLGVTGLRVFTINGGIRTDFGMDINLMKSSRITPSKLRNIALASRMMGFKDPNEDAVFRAFAKGWQGKGISINPNTLDLLLNDKHIAKQYAQALLGSTNPEEARIIRNTSEGLMIGTKKLNSLPDLHDLRYSNKVEGPGVLASQLEGTLLDPKLAKGRGMAWLDIGQSAEGRSLFAGAATTRSRYIPIPLKYLRTSKDANGRVVLNKNHPGYQFARIQKMLEGNPEMILNPKSAEYHSEKAIELRNAFFDLVSEANTTTLVKLGGKKGLFETQNTILVPSSFRARLIPNRSGTTFSNVKDMDSIFTVEVGKQELEEILYRRYHKDSQLAKKGGWGTKNLGNVQKSLRQKGFAYAMVGADPMQRPEHASLVKIKVVDTIKRDMKYGQLNLQAHQVLLKVLERDVDRDAITLTLLENLMGNTPANMQSLDKRFAAQKDNMRIFGWIYEAEAQKTGALVANFASKVLKMPPNAMMGFLGQKAISHLGYSFGRPIDYMFTGLEGGNAAAAGLGINSVPDDIIPKMMAPFMKDSRRGAIAETLLQSLYQGGVKKGGEKGGLVDVTRRVVELAQSSKAAYAQTGSFDVEGITKKGQDIFLDFLRTQDHRSFGASRYLLEQAGASTQSVDLVLQDLARGAANGGIAVSDVSEKLLRGHAQLLSEKYAVGHAFAATFNIATRGIMSMIHTQQASLKADPESVGKKVIAPLADMPVYKDPMVGGSVLEQTVQAVEKAQISVNSLKSKIVDGAAGFFNSPSSKKMFGAGAVVGALGYALYQNIITPDTTQPDDYGPQQAQMSQAVAYGPGMNLSAKVGDPASLAPYQKFNNPSYQNVNINIRDQTRPFDPRLARSQMKRVASSDYSY